MRIQQTTLPNGLRIVTAAQPWVRTVTVNIVTATGGRHEDPAVNGGVSHFLEHLLFKGTRKYPTAQAINEAVDAVGGMNNAYTTEDHTAYYIKLPDRHTSLALDILADMMAHPLFDPAEVDRERGPVIEEMHRHEDSPESLAYTLAPALLFPGNPLGSPVLGSEEVIRNLPVAAIADYHRRHYRPGNLVVVVAGRVEHDAVVMQLAETLGRLRAVPAPPPPAVERHPAEQLVRTHLKDTAQAHLVLATRSVPQGEATSPAANVLSTLLGDGMSSRLFSTIRERQGLAYSVQCFLDQFIDTGAFYAYVGANLDKAPQALESLVEQLLLICHDQITPAELAKAQQQLIVELETRLESNLAMARDLGHQLAVYGHIKSVDEQIAEIEAVTADGVQAVARQLFDPAGFRLSLVAPAAESVRLADCFHRLVGA